MTAISVKGSILDLVYVHTFHLKLLMLVREGFEDPKVDKGSISTSSNPKNSAIHELSSVVNKLELRVLLATQLFNNTL